MSITYDYIPKKYNDKYFQNKIVLRLCFGKQLNNNIINNIDNYFEEYSIGFSLFKNNNNGHPFELIIRILSKYIKNTSNVAFNELLYKIHNTPNHEKYNINECKNFFKNNNREIYKEIKRSSDFSCLIFDICNYIDLNINMCILYKRINIYKTSINNLTEHIDQYEYFRRIYLIESNENNLTDYLINKSQYNKKQNNDINKYYYEKFTIISDKDLLMFDLERYIYSRSKLMNNKYFEIPIILDLPSFVFYENIKFVYELVVVIIYDDVSQKYSLIMKENNKFYIFHHTNKILQCSNEFIINLISTKSTQLFYKKI